MKNISTLAIAALLLAGVIELGFAQPATGPLKPPPPPPGSLQLIKTAQLVSSFDKQLQPVRYYIPEGNMEPKPLLVLLHSWSGNVHQNSTLPWVVMECQKRGWAVVHPDFRGPNNNPQACASPAAIQDIVDAVRWMESQTGIDVHRRYVAGGSGGGHMTLIMAGRHPELWAAASAWVPITDLSAWYHESKARKSRYADNIAASCGGVPGSSPQVDQQYQTRSPLTHLANSRHLPIDINVGITDGHSGSVPVSHSLHAFNLLADLYQKPDVKFSAEEIVSITEQQLIPAADRAAAPVEPERQKPVLLRRTAGPARITIFDGGHESDIVAAMAWLATHHRADAQPLR